MTIRGEASLDAHVPLLIVKFTMQNWNHPCELLLRAKLVPDRAGADTQVITHIPLGWLRQSDRGSVIEQAWINAGLGEPGYLAGKDAEAAACDALTVPVVTGHADMQVIDQIIELALSAFHDHGPERVKSRPLSPQAWAALRYAIARLGVDFLSGPNGLAAALRTGLLQAPFNTPQPAARHRLLRHRPGAHPPRRHHPRQALRLAALRPRRLLLHVRHIVHKEDGGRTSLLCQFHHDVCIHRWGWRIVLHPDGTTSAYGPAGQVLHSHSPPTARAWRRRRLRLSAAIASAPPANTGQH